MIASSMYKKYKLGTKVQNYLLPKIFNKTTSLRPGMSNSNYCEGRTLIFEHDKNVSGTRMQI